MVAIVSSADDCTEFVIVNSTVLI